MSHVNQSKSAWKKRAGDVAVAGVLLVALWASYGCGSEKPETVRQAQRATPTATATPRVTQTAVVRTEPVADVQPRRTGVTYEEAEVAYRNKAYDEATDLFLVYVHENPNSIWGHYMLGLSALKAGALPQAETSFARALEIDSSHVKSLVNVSRVLLAQGRPQEALERIERVIVIDPESVDGYRLLGRAHEDLGNADEAIEAFVQAITFDPEDAWSMNNLGLVFIRQERFDEALGPLARAVELRDDVPVFFNNLGIALERTGHDGNSIEAYQRAIELDPVYEKAQKNLARAEGTKDEKKEKADLTILADEFRREVEGWRAPVVTSESVRPDSLPHPTPR